MKRSTLFVPTMLATALLAACGGGGSNYGMVVSNPPPPAPPPPVSTEPCSNMPMTTDCTVAPTATEPTLVMTDGRTSDHKLIKQGDGSLSLETGTFSFAGGTEVVAGVLSINSEAVLDSNVAISSGAGISIVGDVIGNVDVAADANAYFYGTITGNVTNAGYFASASVDPVTYPQTFDGNFTQTATGTLSVPIAADRDVMLSITGLAQLAGMIELVQVMDWDYAYFPIPETPFAVHALHADGGVTGTFDDWSAPMLFVQGTLRYEPNDVFFDATAVSAQSVMAQAGISDSLTLDTAQRFDRLLQVTGAAKGTFDPRALSQAQDRLLRSAAIVQRIDNYAQALRTFDSLSGTAMSRRSMRTCRTPCRPRRPSPRTSTRRRAVRTARGPRNRPPSRSAAARSSRRRRWATT